MSDVMGIVLAAGKGTRMKTDKPKVLCEVLSRPLVDFVLDAMERAGIRRTVVVVGYRADDVRQALADRQGLDFVEQTEQLGTGHAVMMCRAQIADHTGGVLILTGDSPLAQTSSLAALIDEYQRDRPDCILGTLRSKNPQGLGRIVRNQAGVFQAIVEEKDATSEQRAIDEVNMSTYLFDSAGLLRALDKLDNNNRQQEYYITDCPGILQDAGGDVRALPVLKECEGLSVNTVDELAIVEAEMKRLGY